MSKRKHVWWRPIARFLGHLFSGTVIFLMLCAASVGLSLILHFLQRYQVPAFTIWVLTGLENTILVVDAVLFAVYLAVTATQALREMLE
jgi:hypothetical protein